MSSPPSEPSVSVQFAPSFDFVNACFGGEKKKRKLVVGKALHPDLKITREGGKGGVGGGG